MSLAGDRFVAAWEVLLARSERAVRRGSRRVRLDLDTAYILVDGLDGLIALARAVAPPRLAAALAAPPPADPALPGALVAARAAVIGALNVAAPAGERAVTLERPHAEALAAGVALLVELLAAARAARRARASQAL